MHVFLFQCRFATHFCGARRNQLFFGWLGAIRRWRRWNTLLQPNWDTQRHRRRRVQAMREAFPEAAVNFPKSLIHSCEGIPDPDDRHVVAAAIHCHSHAIITANLKHFPKDCLGAHDILVQSPDDFLKHQFHLNGDRMLEVLDIQASAIGKERGEILELLKLDAPGFVELIRKKF